MNALSRKDAKAAGLRRYFSGVPCSRGHVAERIVSTAACSTCARERAASWRKANPAKDTVARLRRLASKPRVRSLENPARQKARHRKWYVANKERANAQHCAWAQRNGAKVNAAAARRRARKLQQTPPWADHEAIGAVYAVAHRLRETGHDVHVDHVIPLQGRTVSGLHIAANLAIIEAVANRSKSNQS